MAVEKLGEWTNKSQVLHGGSWITDGMFYKRPSDGSWQNLWGCVFEPLGYATSPGDGSKVLTWRGLPTILQWNVTSTVHSGWYRQHEAGTLWQQNLFGQQAMPYNIYWCYLRVEYKSGGWWLSGYIPRYWTFVSGGGNVQFMKVDIPLLKMTVPLGGWFNHTVSWDANFDGSYNGTFNLRMFTNGVKVLDITPQMSYGQQNWGWSSGDDKGDHCIFTQTEKGTGNTHGDIGHWMCWSGGTSSPGYNYAWTDNDLINIYGCGKRKTIADLASVSIEARSGEHLGDNLYAFIDFASGPNSGLSAEYHSDGIVAAGYQPSGFTDDFYVDKEGPEGAGSEDTYGLPTSGSGAATVGTITDDGV